MGALIEIMYYNTESDEHCVEYQEVKVAGDGEPSMILLRDVTGQEDRRAIIHLCDDVEEKYRELTSQ